MIVINLDKAKNISHDIRRNNRNEEFLPYDEIIAKRIPGKSSEEAELARQQIREKYSVMQEAIEAAQSAEDLKVALGIPLTPPTEETP